MGLRQNPPNACDLTMSNGLTSGPMADQIPAKREETKEERVRRKIEAAMRLEAGIKPSFWGVTPLMSPRVAALYRDPETREVLMRAIRGERKV